ncbi:MAG: hypothetical protein COB66_09275 [Coxiella sp. (in: Bacteria)]|nr:MAG: hypothetical protein COB66_09275 [Coxiella sp. (in: g-proteobacteria)]
MEGSAFKGCTDLTSIKIPTNMTSIGYSAFADCTGLTSITIPNSVTSIEGHAFEGCTGLTSVEIPNSVTSIEYNAFEGCTGLTSIKIPTSVTSIKRNAFEGCTGLTSIKIPTSVTSIKCNAFEGCTGLTSVEIPTSVTLIESSAFKGCTGLMSITIPTSVTSIGISAFQGCTALPSIDIPNSVTSIKYNAFANCTGLTFIKIPTSVTSTGAGAFSGLDTLKAIIVKAIIPKNTYVPDAVLREKFNLPAQATITYTSGIVARLDGDSGELKLDNAKGLFLKEKILDDNKRLVPDYSFDEAGNPYDGLHKCLPKDFNISEFMDIELSVAAQGTDEGKKSYRDFTLVYIGGVEDIRLQTENGIMENFKQSGNVATAAKAYEMTTSCFLRQLYLLCLEPQTPNIFRKKLAKNMPEKFLEELHTHFIDEKTDWPVLKKLFDRIDNEYNDQRKDGVFQLFNGLVYNENPEVVRKIKFYCETYPKLPLPKDKGIILYQISTLVADLCGSNPLSKLLKPFNGMIYSAKSPYEELSDDGKAILKSNQEENTVAQTSVVC